MKPNILYIEDHPDNMTLVRRIFQAESYNLIEAKTGMLGISIAENQAVDVILLDINLPDLDGYEVARRLRNSKKVSLSHIPIIAVTANAMKGDAQKAVEAGFSLHIPKPINIQEILEVVDSYVMMEARGV